jgi:hypothetical protein
MPEAKLIRAGYRFERARTEAQRRAAAQVARALLATAADPTEARRLIDRGRAEARLSRR